MLWAKLWTQPKSLGLFFVSAVLWFLLCTLLWMPVAKWTSYPVGYLTQWSLAVGAPYWVRSVQVSAGHIEVDTRITVALASNSGQGVAELVAEADPAHFAYGLPLFIALLLAVRSRHFFKKLLLGYGVLLFSQTFSVVFGVLRQIMVGGGRHGGLNIEAWQMEGIALGYQLGVLLVPTLVPVLLWLWLERAFVSAVILDGWLRRSLPK